MAARDCLNDFSMMPTVNQGKAPGENAAKLVQFISSFIFTQIWIYTQGVIVLCHISHTGAY
jgi:hypothetical protein